MVDSDLIREFEEALEQVRLLGEYQSLQEAFDQAAASCRTEEEPHMTLCIFLVVFCSMYTIVVPNVQILLAAFLLRWHTAATGT